MLSVSYIFRRFKNGNETAGVLYVTLSERCQRTDGSSGWLRSYVNTGIMSADGEITDDIRPTLNGLIRLIYCIIERLDAADEPYSRQDIVKRLKLAMADDPSMKGIINKAKTNFPLRSDLVSLGNDLKRGFQFIYSQKLSKPTADSDTITGFLKHKSLEFKNEGKNATARSYANTSGSLEKFNNGNTVKLSLVDREYLVRYSEWLQGNGVSDSTQSFYLRTLRSALNYAFEERRINIEPNLFEGLNTKIYRADKTNAQIGLGRELMRQISDLTFPNDHETEIVRDMFLFAFYCHGLELSDVLNLKKSNISGAQLIFNRRQKGIQRAITLDNASIQIIDRYAQDSSEYIFPLMEKYKGLLYYSVSERVRKSIKKIGKKVSCPALSFSSNISAWHKIVSQLVPSDIVLGRTS